MHIYLPVFWAYMKSKYNDVGYRKKSTILKLKNENYESFNKYKENCHKMKQRTKTKELCYKIKNISFISKLF